MKIDPHISNYIDESIERSIERSIARSSKITDEKIEIALERSRQSFKIEQDHHLDALKEFFEDKLKAIIEYCSAFPTREEVRSIVHEEVAPLENRISLITEEIIEHRRELGKHDKRITKLENVLV